MCNFGDKIFLKGGKCKIVEKCNFYEKWQNGNLPLKNRLKT